MFGKHDYYSPKLLNADYYFISDTGRIYYCIQSPKNLKLPVAVYEGNDYTLKIL